MNIVIIGCGYVGSAAAKYWKKKGYFVSATTRFKEKLPVLSAFLDRAVLFSEMDEILDKADAVLLSVAADNKESYEEAYLLTAKKLLASLSSRSSLLYTSSTSVYGDHQGNWVTEDSPLHPISSQAKILCETESLLLPRATIFRLGEIYGPTREWKDKIARMQGKSLPGTGDQWINIIHLNNIVTALDFALEHSLQGIFNLVEDLHISRKEWYAQLCGTGNLPELKWDPSLSSLHGGNKRVSNAKIKAAGFHFTNFLS